MSLRIKNAELVKVIGTGSKVPVNDCYEFAFAGKSNVGKSSMINALMNRNSLARTSATPGKTQTINYYKVDAFDEEAGDTELLLVDLPGYGYTKASTDTRISWGKMVERYLRETKTLKSVFLLVDIRHKPTDNDIEMHDWILSKGFVPVIVATKLDKLKKNEIPKAIALIRETLSMGKNEILIPFSSETKKGREEIYNILIHGEADNGTDHNA